MSVETRIQAAVARADLIICAALRVLGILLVLSVVLALGVMIFRRIVWNDHYHWQDPCWIDYDGPGVDITSEGP